MSSTRFTQCREKIWRSIVWQRQLCDFDPTGRLSYSWQPGGRFMGGSRVFLQRFMAVSRKGVCMKLCWNVLKEELPLHKIWQLVRDTLQKSTWLLDIIGGKISLLTFSYHNGRRQLLPSWMQFLLGVETSLLLSPGLLSFGLISNDISFRANSKQR